VTGTLSYRITMRTMPEAGQMFFKACEAARIGNPIGIQALEILSCCAFPNVKARAENALHRFSRDAAVQKLFRDLGRS
jgi:hypothetical protein